MGGRYRQRGVARESPVRASTAGGRWDVQLKKQFSFTHSLGREGRARVGSCGGLQGE